MTIQELSELRVGLKWRADDHRALVNHIQEIDCTAQEAIRRVLDMKARPIDAQGFSLAKDLIGKVRLP